MTLCLVVSVTLLYRTSISVSPRKVGTGEMTRGNACAIRYFPCLHCSFLLVCGGSCVLRVCGYVRGYMDVRLAFCLCFTVDYTSEC